MNAILQRRDAETQRWEETRLSLTPGFSQVMDADESEKPLKRFAHHAVANTRLKPGANEMDDVIINGGVAC